MKIPKRESLFVKRVKDRQGIEAVTKDFGLFEQTLRNWVRAFDAGEQNDHGAKKVMAEGDGAIPSASEEPPTQAGVGYHKKSGGVLREGCAVKYALIAEQKDFPLVRMCWELQLSGSCYQAWKRGGTSASGGPIARC